MTNLLGISTIVWIGIGLGVFIVFSLIMHFVNRSFRVNYGLNLFGGGLLMLVTIVAVVGGYFLIKSDSAIGYALIALGVVLVIVTLIYDCKKCGGMGVVALFCQILFCVGSLLLLLEFFRTKGLSSDIAREDRIVRQKRQERMNENNYYDDYR